MTSQINNFEICLFLGFNFNTEKNKNEAVNSLGKNQSIKLNSYDYVNLSSIIHKADELINLYIKIKKTEDEEMVLNCRNFDFLNREIPLSLVILVGGQYIEVWTETGFPGNIDYIYKYIYDTVNFGELDQNQWHTYNARTDSNYIYISKNDTSNNSDIQIYQFNRITFKNKLKAVHIDIEKVLSYYKKISS